MLSEKLVLTPEHDSITIRFCDTGKAFFYAIKKEDTVLALVLNIVISAAEQERLALLRAKEGLSDYSLADLTVRANTSLINKPISIFLPDDYMRSYERVRIKEQYAYITIFRPGCPACEDLKKMYKRLHKKHADVQFFNYTSSKPEYVNGKAVFPSDSSVQGDSMRALLAEKAGRKIGYGYFDAMDIGYNYYDAQQVEKQFPSSGYPQYLLADQNDIIRAVVPYCPAEALFVENQLLLLSRTRFIH